MIRYLRIADSTEQNQNCGESLSQPEMLAHHGDRNDHCAWRFQIEQERAADGGELPQSEQHQDRPQYAAEADDAHHQWQVPAIYRSVMRGRTDGSEG